GDGVPAGELDQLGHERLTPRDDERLGPQHVEDAGARQRRNRGRDRRDPSLDVHEQRARRLLVPGQRTEPRDEVGDVAHVMGGAASATARPSMSRAEKAAAGAEATRTSAMASAVALTRATRRTP